MNASSVPASPAKKLSTLLGSLVVASGMIATPAHAATQNVTLSNFMYAPAALTVAAGDSVTWSYDGMDGQTGLYGIPRPQRHSRTRRRRPKPLRPRHPALNGNRLNELPERRPRASGAKPSWADRTYCPVDIA